MVDAFSLRRTAVVFAILVPLAIALGYFLATPESMRTIMFVAMAMGVAAIPFLLRWHHPLVIVTWNAALVTPFLPGQPRVWVTAAAGSLLLSLLARTMNRDFQFLQVRSVGLPLVLIAGLVIVTAQLTGGIGGYSLGQERWGAKRYLGALGAVAGYFALTARALPPDQALRYAALFFLSGLTAVVSDLVYMAGPKLYALYVLFPAELAYNQLLSRESLMRLTGFTWASQSVCWFLMLRYGIRGLMDLQKPWRFFLFVLCFGVGLTGGFRSTILLASLVFAAQFYFEGLYRTRFLLIFLVTGFLLATLTVVFVDKMPLAVQRSLSFLPINVDPAARLDAEGTLDWRLTIWRTVLPEVPKYLLLGKGYAYSGTDYILTSEAIRRGIYPEYEEALISGNYHSGILTLLIPFGAAGAILFLWFCVAGFMVLYRNYRYSSESLRLVNTFMLSYYLARLTFYFVFYGQFDLDLFIFTGLVGLSVSLNGGVRGAETVAAKAEVAEAAAVVPVAPAQARSPA